MSVRQAQSPPATAGGENRVQQLLLLGADEAKRQQPDTEYLDHTVRKLGSIDLQRSQRAYAYLDQLLQQWMRTVPEEWDYYGIIKNKLTHLARTVMYGNDHDIYGELYDLWYFQGRMAVNDKGKWVQLVRVFIRGILDAFHTSGLFSGVFDALRAVDSYTPSEERDETYEPDYFDRMVHLYNLLNRSNNATEHANAAAAPGTTYTTNAASSGTQYSIILTKKQIADRDVAAAPETTDTANAASSGSVISILHPKQNRPRAANAATAAAPGTTEAINDARNARRRARYKQKNADLATTTAPAVPLNKVDDDDDPFADDDGLVAQPDFDFEFYKQSLEL